MAMTDINNGEPYFLKADISKAGESTVSINKYIKMRAFDNGKILPVKWLDQRRVMNVNGMIPFIEGSVGQWSTDDNDNIVMAPDAVHRDWQGSAANTRDGGWADYILTDQMFTEEGIFYGFIGLMDGNGRRLTSINIWFRVLGDNLIFGLTQKYYSNKIEKFIRQMQAKANDAFRDFNEQGAAAIQKLNDDYTAKTQEAQNALTKATADLNSYAATVETMDGQIKAKALATKPELEQAKSDITKIVEDKTANLESVAKANFNTVPSLDQLKQDHATGAEGYWITLDTKHLYIWSGSEWTDIGPAGIGDGTVPGQTIKAKSIFDPQVGTINASRILDSYADISNAEPWGLPNTEFSIDRQNTAITSTQAGNRGIMFPVELDSISDPLYIDFNYYYNNVSSDNYLNAYICRNDGTVIDSIVWQSDKSFGSAKICITSQFITDNALDKKFKVLIACHGGPSTMDIDLFRVSKNPNNLTLTDKFKKLDLLTIPNGFDITESQGWMLTQGQDTFHTDSTEAVFKTGDASTPKGIMLVGRIVPNVTNYIQIQYGVVSPKQYKVSAFLTNGRNLTDGVYATVGAIDTNTGIHTVKYELTPTEIKRLGIVDRATLTVGGQLNSLIIKSVRISTTKNGIGILDAVNAVDNSKDVIFGSSMAQMSTATAKSIDGLKLVTPGEKYDQDNGRLKHITLYATEAGGATMFIGKLDQNNLLVDFRKYPVHYSKGFNELDFSTQNIPVNKGEYVFLNCSVLGVYRPDTTHPLGNTTRVQDSHHVMSGQYSGNTFYSADVLAPFEYTVAPATATQLSDSLSQGISDTDQKVSDIKKEVKQVAVLTSPSGKKFRISVDDNGSLSAVSTIPTNVQIFGNSLTCYYKDGFPALGASDQNHDWYHYVTDYIKSANSNAVIGPRRNVAPWEQNANRDEQFNQLIKPNLSADTDLVILQLGDNVNSDALHAGFASDVMNLFKNIKTVSPKAKIYFVGMWFCGWQDMIDSARAACSKYDGTFVDITDLANNSDNKAYIGEVVTLPDGTTKTLTSEGEANHPGNAGYKKIADRIIDSLDF